MSVENTRFGVIFMLENKYKQISISEHISLYDKIIPQDHFLRRLKENIDFSFVNNYRKY